MMPATCVASSKKKEGPNRANVTVDNALPMPVMITTGTTPVAASSGTCKLICPGLTYERKAALPSMVTLVPPRDIGKFPVELLVKSVEIVIQLRRRDRGISFLLDGDLFHDVDHGVDASRP